MDKKIKSKTGENGGVSRRGFIKTAAVTSVAASQVPRTVSSAVSASPPNSAEALGQIPTQKITITVNGEARTLEVEPRWTLAFLLREKLELTGAKVGCDRAMCGFCTVIVDGVPLYSCNMLAVQANGANIETIESLSDGYDYETLHPLQKSFVDAMAFQCAYCTSAQILTAKTLLDREQKPSLDAVKWNQRGVLCRCGCYPKIFKAVLQAAEMPTFMDPERIGA